MANKQLIKFSEARIIVFLNNSVPALHYVKKISSKLDMDYSYILNILARMKEKNWLNGEKSISNARRTYYHLTKDGLNMLDLAIAKAAKLKEE